MPHGFKAAPRVSKGIIHPLTEPLYIIHTSLINIASCLEFSPCERKADPGKTGFIPSIDFAVSSFLID